MIPKVLHQFWDKPALRDRHIPWIESFKRLNPSWECVMWTPDMIMRDADFGAIIPMMRDPLMPSTIKSDLFRQAVLYLHGGFYADTDCECIRPLDMLLYLFSQPYIIGWEQDCNTRLQRSFAGSHFIGAEPGHDVSGDALAEFVENVNRHYVEGQVEGRIMIRPYFRDCWDLLYTSGPQALQPILDRWGIIPLAQNCFSPCSYLPRPSTEELLALSGPVYVFHYYDGLQVDGWTQQPNFLTK